MMLRAAAAAALLTAGATWLVHSGRVEPEPPLTPGAFYMRLAVNVRGVPAGVQHWARNGEGWIAYAQTRPGVAPVNRELLDGNGSLVLLQDEVRARSTFDRVERGLDPFGMPASGCTMTVTGRRLSGLRIGETRVAGLRAIVFQRMVGVLEKWTEWLAPDLGCAVLRSVTERRTTREAAWHIERMMLLEELTLGRTPEWIFRLTPDYREMNPLAVMRWLGDDSDMDSESLLAIDRLYRTNAARRRDPVYADSPSPERASTR